MEFKASHQYAPVTARKARPVINMVRGLPVNEALEALRGSHRRAASMLNKVIRSAVANAEQEKAIGAGELIVVEAFVNEGPLKQGRLRWRPGAMGRIKPIRKRTSHIHVKLVAVEGGSGGSGRRRGAAAAADSAAAGEDS